MDTKRFLRGPRRKIIRHALSSFLGAFCIIILLFLMELSYRSINTTWALEYLTSLSQISQITLTDSLCVEFQDGVHYGVLVDNFENYSIWHVFNWQNGWEPRPFYWDLGPDFTTYPQSDFTPMFDFERASQVLDAYRPMSKFLIWHDYYKLMIRKKTLYKNHNGEEHFIPADFPVLNFEVRTPIAFEQSYFSRFEVEVTTENNGYAKIFIIPQNKPGYGASADALDTVANN